MTNEDSIYLEKGDISLNNQRFVNQIALSSVVPFIPTPIAADSSTINELIDQQSFSPSGQRLRIQNPSYKYPVEKIHGPQWQSFLNSSEIFWENKQVHFTFKDHLLVTLQIIEQLKYLWENFGIVLADRNGTNVLLNPVRRANQESQPKWQVYQVDVEYVYDAVKDRHNIDKSVILRDRMGKFGSQDIKNIGMADQYISLTIKEVVENLIKLVRLADYSNQISPQQKLLISSFSKAWDLDERTGVLFSPLNLDFKTALEFIKRLLEIEKNDLSQQSLSPILSLMKRVRRLFSG